MRKTPKIVAALGEENERVFRRGVRLRVLDGVLNGLAVCFAFALLVYITGGGSVPTALIALAIVTPALLLLRFFAGSNAMRMTYLTTMAGGLALRRKVLAHLTRLPLGAFRTLHSGKIAQALSEDMMWLETQASFFAPGRKAETALLLVLLAGVAMLHWPSALATVLVWGGGMLVLAYLGRLLKRGLRLRSDGMAEASRHIMEYADGMQVIRAFGNAREAERDYDKWVGIMRQGFVTSVKRNTPIVAVAAGLGIASVGVGAIVALLTLPEDGNIARVIAAIGLLTATLIPARAMIAFNNIEKLADVSEQNVMEIANMPEISAGNVVAEPGPAEVVFDGVDFAYDGGKAALSDISFTARPGSLTAIVGRSGSGKTTLANLLLRFWQHQSGTIRMNGRPIEEYTIESYMDRFAVVFQETMLFRDTVANNIRIGKPDATEAEIVAAAKAAQIHDTIMALPGGYDAVVGSGGSTLSGGERQRVTIARAILKDADIVILDEATSALDPENEREIQAAFEALAREKTVFIIAHRLSTIVDADNILLLDEGRIVAQGQHDALMAEAPLYKRLWDSYRAISEWTL